jgi:DNA-binding response OmpR family regulator
MPHVLQPTSCHGGKVKEIFLQQETVKIVVVDDLPDAANALALLLRLDGFDVHVACTAEESIVLVEREHPHVVMLDIGMPGIDGYELATLLRHRYQDDIVLIAVTGSDPKMDRVADTFAIVDYHLHKPVDVKSLRRLLGPPDHSVQVEPA